MLTLSVTRRTAKINPVNIEKFSLSVAVISAVASLTAIILQSDFFCYLCGTVALVAAYAYDNSNRKGGCNE